MNIQDIPTPETDKAEYEIYLCKHRRLVVRPDLSRDLERRLTVAREALERVTIWSTENSVISVSKRALIDTAPKP